MIVRDAFLAGSKVIRFCASPVDAGGFGANIYAMPPRFIPMLGLNSSSISAAGYDRKKHTLRLRYTGGATYDYLDVPAAVYRELLEAPSKGQFVNSHVKPNFPCTRVK